MGSVRLSLLLSFAESNAGMTLQLISTVILARILTPAEIGTFSVGASLVMLAIVIRDFGVAEYLIQERDLTRETLKAALLVNILISWLMAAVVFASHGVVTRFYGEDGVGQVMLVLGCNLMLIPFGAVTMAFFRRQLNYRPIFWIGIVANTVSTVIAIVLALRGFGYMSMAWASLSNVVVTVVMANLLRPREVPLMPGVKGLRAALTFGTFASGVYLVDRLGKSAPDLILGRVFNMEAVGLFSRAAGLVDLFNRAFGAAILRVVLPYFSERNRSGDSLKVAFLRTVAYMTGIGWAFFAVLALLAFPAIRILYGGQWDAAVVLLQILCVAFALDVVMSNSAELLVSLGHVRRASRLQFELLAPRVIGILAGVPFGLEGVCIGVAVASAVNFFVALRALGPHLSLTARDLAACVAKSAAVAVMTVVPVAVTVGVLGMSAASYLVAGVLGGCLALLAWVGAIFAVGHPLAVEVHLAVSKIRAGIGRRGTGSEGR